MNDNPIRRTLTVSLQHLLILLLLAVGAPGRAAPYCELDPERPKRYRLELSVPATFCRGRSGDPSCRTFPKPSLIQLHGLWPNYRSGFPEGKCSPGECVRQDPELGTYCRYPEPPGLYDAVWWQGLRAYMAGTESCLERHEWVKHGTCSTMSAEDYFQRSLETAKRIATRLGTIGDRTMTRPRFNRLVRTRLPELDGAIRLTCKGDALASIYVLYEWGQWPVAPIPTPKKANHFGNCPDAFVVPATPGR